MKRFQYFLFLVCLTATNILAQTTPKPAPVKKCNAVYAQQLVEQQATESKSTPDADKSEFRRHKKSVQQNERQ